MRVTWDFYVIRMLSIYKTDGWGEFRYCSHCSCQITPAWPSIASYTLHCTDHKAQHLDFQIILGHSPLTYFASGNVSWLLHPHIWALLAGSNKLPDQNKCRFVFITVSPKLPCMLEYLTINTNKAANRDTRTYYLISFIPRRCPCYLGNIILVNLRVILDISTQVVPQPNPQLAHISLPKPMLFTQQ